MIYSHYSEAPWDDARWPNFSAAEVSCRCCGELFWAPEEFDMIQAARNELGKSIHLNCAHRCPVHNAHVGGAPLSQHKKIAFDVSIFSGSAMHDLPELFGVLKTAGFRAFGFYNTFIHTDARPRSAFWIEGAAGRKRWESVISTLGL